MRMVDLTRGQQYPERTYGMEIEVEYCTSWPINQWMWQRTEDGSLRHEGAEWITRPIGYDPMMEAVESFYRDGFDPFEWRGTKRCGIHLHMDTSTLTLDEFRAVITAYAALEPVLFSELCGAEREENIYCIPWYRARQEALYVQAFLNNPEIGPYTLRDLGGILCKYSALYLEPLRRFGTIEFRGAPTYDNGEQAGLLVTTFDDLLRLAAADGTAANVVARFSNIMEATRYYLPHLVVPDADQRILRADSLGVADLFVPDPPNPQPVAEDDGAEWTFPKRKAMTASAYRAVVSRGGRDGGEDNLRRLQAVLEGGGRAQIQVRMEPPRPPSTLGDFLVEQRPPEPQPQAQEQPE